MKKCSYCGKEYSDEATNCAIDGELLSDNSLQLAMAEKQEAETTKKKEEPYLLFPDYKWSARDAWKCIGIILLLDFVMELVVFTLDWHFSAFRTWHRSGLGYFFTRVLFYTIDLLVAAYFARTETLTTFWKGFGLDRKPSDYVWFGLVCILVLRFISHFIFIHGWGKGVSNYDLSSFKTTFGVQRYFFLLPMLILAPVFEESIYRGFLYKAFRGSFGIGISMAFVVLWTVFTHWSAYFHSLFASIVLSIWTIIQCYLREKSNSLWDCIICHIVFNAWLLLVSSSPQ